MLGKSERTCSGQQAVGRATDNQSPGATSLLGTHPTDAASCDRVPFIPIRQCHHRQSLFHLQPAIVACTSRSGATTAHPTARSLGQARSPHREVINNFVLCPSPSPSHAGASGRQSHQATSPPLHKWALTPPVRGIAQPRIRLAGLVGPAGQFTTTLRTDHHDASRRRSLACGLKSPGRQARFKSVHQYGPRTSLQWERGDLRRSSKQKLPNCW